MKEILSAEVAEKKLKRMALEIAERNQGTPELVLIGIRENGVVIAARIAAYLSSFYKGSVSLLDLSMNKKDPGSVSLSKDISLNGKTVIMADDVVNSGKTLFYALRPLIEQRPARVEILALVARMHKQFPIAVDYVGMTISTTLQDHIEVLVEGDKVSGARLI
jgi:pyrimidine operon attenuation protein/uracil phosphoribosyltransferase